jgi:iron(III) transport system substrate-binding protein
VRENPKFWDMIKAFGASGVQAQASTDTMLDHVVSGENLIAYNVIGSYALARAKKDPALGVAFLKDYTVVLSRVMLINKEGQHPNAAKLWLDYILSKRGQTIIANEAQMYSVRHDVVGETTAAGLTKQLGSSLKPIAVDAMLLRYLNQGRKQALLKEWKDAAAIK